MTSFVIIVVTILVAFATTGSTSKPTVGTAQVGSGGKVILVCPFVLIVIVFVHRSTQQSGLVGAEIPASAKS